MSCPCPFDGGIIGTNSPKALLLSSDVCIGPKSTIPYVYPDPPDITFTDCIIPVAATVTLTFAPVPSPKIFNV